MDSEEYDYVDIVFDEEAIALIKGEEPKLKWWPRFICSIQKKRFPSYTDCCVVIAGVTVAIFILQSELPPFIFAKSRELLGEKYHLGTSFAVSMCGLVFASIYLAVIAYISIRLKNEDLFFSHYGVAVWLGPLLPVLFWGVVFAIPVFIIVMTVVHILALIYLVAKFIVWVVELLFRF